MSFGDSTYRVVFAGNPQTSLEIVDRYALYRAAELTIQHGGDYFIVLSDKADNNTTTSSGGSSTANANVNNTTQPAGSVFPSSTTATASTSTSYYSSSSTEHSSIKNIRYYRGDKPRNNPDAYDARAIVGNMQSQLATDQGRADQAAQSTNTGDTIYYVLAGILIIVFFAAYGSSH